MFDNPYSYVFENPEQRKQKSCLKKHKESCSKARRKRKRKKRK